MQALLAQRSSDFLRILSSSLHAKKLLSSPSVLFNNGVQLTTAASAAFLPASSSDDVFAFELPPRVLGGPPTVFCAGIEEVVLGAGAEERVRPGWENGSLEDSLPQRAPIVYKIYKKSNRAIETTVWGSEKELLIHGEDS